MKGSQCVAASSSATRDRLRRVATGSSSPNGKTARSHTWSLARIDSKKIKADTFYMLKGGKFTEVQA